ncbi:MAG TPA: CHAT domain-containing protein [Thermoanaerobaculia bacterium]|nr:CHAT domain-containing protein [Thermoanaerobaculia bacterium]
MNVIDFLAISSNRENALEAVLRIQREVAPEEAEVTSSYASPLMELAARGELPAANASQDSLRFGAADWMLIPILFMVMGALQQRLSTESETITEAEVRTWVLRSGSPGARKLIPELTRSLQNAFRDILLAGTGPWRTPKKDPRKERWTDISCPRQVWKETARFNLVVRLVLGPVPQSVATTSLDVEPGETVRVDLQAPAFEILGDSWQGIDIVSGQDSAPAVFDLRPRELGNQRLTLSFFQAGHPLGAVTVPVEVVEQPVPEAQTRLPAPILFLESEAPPPDRVLLIAWHPEISTLAFTLIQGGGSSWSRFPPLRVQREPAAWADPYFQTLDGLARPSKPDDRRMAAEEQIKILGQNLWKELPEELRHLYARERQSWKNGSLLIYSDEPHLPWELVWPHGAGWEDKDPWCLTLCLSRWLRRNEQGDGNSGAPGRLPLTALACIAPSDAHLPAAQRESMFLRNLLGPLGVRDASPSEPTSRGVMDLLRSGSYDWLHASAHGSFSVDFPNHSSVLWLQGGEALTPRHLVGPEVSDHLRQVRPAFFFNVCHSGRLGWDLTGLGGWADRLISDGAGLFLGPLWKVEDQTASKVAEKFYECLLGGKTAAEAAREARIEARRVGNSAWMAYSLYAHPNATVRLPDESPAEYV